jgi:hypothetical protein
MAVTQDEQHELDNHENQLTTESTEKNEHQA